MEKLEEKFEISLDANPPRVAIVCIPIGKYADDLEDGMALLHGKMREAEARLSKILIQLKQQKMANGVIGPDGKPTMSVA